MGFIAGTAERAERAGGDSWSAIYRPIPDGGRLPKDQHAQGLMVHWSHDGPAGSRGGGRILQADKWSLLLKQIRRVKVGQAANCGLKP